MAGPPFNIGQSTLQRSGRDVVGPYTLTESVLALSVSPRTVVANENAMAARIADNQRTASSAAPLCRFIRCQSVYCIIGSRVIRTGATMTGTSKRDGSVLSGVISIRIAFGAFGFTQLWTHISGFGSSCSSLKKNMTLREFVCQHKGRLTNLNRAEDHPWRSDRRVVDHTYAGVAGRQRPCVPKFVDDKPYAFSALTGDHLILEDARIPTGRFIKRVAWRQNASCSLLPERRATVQGDSADW